MAKNKEQMQMLIRKQQEILDAARAENRPLNEDELARMAGLQRSITEAAGEEGEENGEGCESPAGDGQRSVEAERNRVSEIFDMCREFGMDAGEYIRSGVSVDAARKAVMDELKKRNTPVRGGAHVENTGEENFRRDMTNGLMLRSGIQLDNVTTEARGFARTSLRDMAIMCLVRDGENVNDLLRMDNNAVFEKLMSRQYYNPTAAFPAILDTAVQASIVHIYEAVPTTFQEWTSEGNLKDFKSTDDHTYIVGGAGELLLVPENGELKADTPGSEKLPQRKLETYGRQFSMSRQAFINDDIGFLTEVPGIYAAGTKRQINRQCYRALFNNGTIFDGKTLFHEEHRNLVTTGSAPSVDAVVEMMVMMATQKDPFGNTINVNPDKVIVPVGWNFKMDSILNSQNIPGSANNDVNPLRNEKIKVIADAELNALAGTGACPWFMAANTLTARGIQVDYLNGQKTPTIRRAEVPGTLGFVWDIYMDWGISVRDFRGFVKNPGATLGK